MRKFNDFEKAILVKLDNRSKEKESKSEILKILDFFIETILDDRGISINDEKKMMTLMYDRDLDPNASKEMINFFSLIDYLEKNGLIIKFKNDFLPSKPENFLSNTFISYSKECVFPIRRKDGLKKKLPNFSITYPAGYYSKIISLMQYQIQLSPALEYLINDNFLTVEEKAFKQSKIQTILSFMALGLSFLTLGISWVLFINSEKKEITLSENQLDKITLPLENLVIRIDSIESKLNSDTTVISMPNSQLESITIPLEKISSNLQNLRSNKNSVGK